MVVLMIMIVEVMSAETDIEPKEIDVDETVTKKKEEKEEKTKGRALMIKKERATGSINKKVYRDYLKSAGGIIIYIFILNS